MLIFIVMVLIDCLCMRVRSVCILDVLGVVSCDMIILFVM